MVYLGYTILAGTQTVGCRDVVITLKNLYNKNIMMKKLIFNTAKEGFRKMYRKHKAEVRAQKRAKKVAPRDNTNIDSMKKSIDLVYSIRWCRSKQNGHRRPNQVNSPR